MTESGTFDRPTMSREVNVYDLWGVLLRRWGVGVTLTLLCVTAAALYAFVLPRSYVYTTAVEIGSVVNVVDGERVREPIQSPVSTEQRLLAAYVPRARQELSDPGEKAPSVEVTIQDDTDLVLLTSIAKEDVSERIDALHKRIASLIVESHEERMASIRDDLTRALEESTHQLEYLQRGIVRKSRIQPLEEALAEARRRLEAIKANYEAQSVQLQNEQENLRLNLAELEDQRGVLKRQVDRTDRERELVKEQLSKSADTLDELLSTRVQATSEISTSPEAMSLLMMSNQVEQARTRVDELQTRLEITFPQRLDQINNQLEDNLREQTRIKNDISALDKRIAKLENDYNSDLADQRSRVASAETKLEGEQLDYSVDIEGQEFNVRAAKNRLSALIPTHSLHVALRSLEPSGPGSLVVLVLGAALGGVIGLFAVVTIEFVSRANRYLASVG